MPDIKRRQLLTAAAGCSAGILHGTEAWTADFLPLEIFLSMRRGLPGKRAVWWYSGELLGRVDGSVAVPLLSIQGISHTQLRAVGDGSYLHTMTEAGYYGDLVTGEVVDSWLNPLNAKRCDAKHYFSSQRLLFNPDLTITRGDTAALPGDLAFNGRITGPDVKHDRVWMGEELFVNYQPPQGIPVIANSLANFEASWADATNPDLQFVPTTMQYTTINSFRPWMQMGDAVGTISMRLNGIKLASFDVADAELMKRILRDHPTYLE